MKNKKMKYIKKVILTIVAIIALAGYCAAAEPVLDSLKIQGRMRRFWIYMPDGIEKDAPLVFVLHGYGNPGTKETWMNKAAEAHKFAVCVPHGWKDLQGKPSWNVGYPFQEGWKVNEVAGMEQLARYVQKKYHLSRRNTFMRPIRYPSAAAAMSTTPVQAVATTWMPVRTVTFSKSSGGL